jgi:hypothetical protein
LDIDAPHSTINAGLFINSNVMGETAGLVLVAACVYRFWWLVPGILPAFIIADCRGAFVAVACAGILWLRHKSKKLVVVIVLAMIAGLIAYDRSSEVRHHSVMLRFQMWEEILPHLSIMGSGIGSFFTLYPMYSSMDTVWLRPEHLHNDWLEYAFETGFIGFASLMLFICVTRSIVLAALIVEGCFGFPTHMAATAVLGGIVAGYDTRHRASLRVDVDAWRISLRGWLHGISGQRFNLASKEGGRGIPA